MTDRNASTAYDTGLIMTIIFNHMGSFVTGNRAPLRKKSGKVTKLEMRPKPSGLSIMEPIANPRDVTAINSRMTMTRVKTMESRLK